MLRVRSRIERSQGIVLPFIGANHEGATTLGRFPNDADLLRERAEAQVAEDVPVHMPFPPLALLFDGS